MPAPRNAGDFRKPNLFDWISNEIFGVMVALGLGLPHNYLLFVRGRKTGRLRFTPVNLLDFRGKRYLVAGRGRTQWVRNAETAGEIGLLRYWRRQTFKLRSVPDSEKPEILKAYLDRYWLTVQRYFTVRAGSEPAAFVAVADRYPVFELLPAGR